MAKRGYCFSCGMSKELNGGFCDDCSPRNPSAAADAIFACVERLDWLKKNRGRLRSKGKKVER